MTSAPDHWGFYQLPPFFTEQPAPATHQRQVALWAALILDHAAYWARQSKEGTCAAVRFYTASSDIFANTKLRRRLSAPAARAMMTALVDSHPNQAVLVEGSSEDALGVLVAANEGGLSALEQSLLSWILEMGQGTTTTMLTKKGAVMTFDELAESKCLQYNQSPFRFLARTSKEAVPVGDVGALSEEQAVRAFLDGIHSHPVSVMKPFAITLFNLDGSTKQPYQGVKFGGQ